MLNKVKYLLILCLTVLPTVFVFADEGHGAGAGDLSALIFSTKYILSIILVVVGVVILWKYKFAVSVRMAWGVMLFILFGIFFPFFPSPICAMEKPFVIGFRSHFVVMLVFMTIFSIAGTKLFCGLICPLGGIQESLYHLPILKKLKRKKVPFAISNTIRILILAAFVIIVLTTGVMIFDKYLSGFKLFHWHFDVPFMVLLPFAILLGLIFIFSFFVYRPYCYFVCPIGFFSWIFEQVAPLRVRLNKDKCDVCNICIKESPCTAIKNIIAEDTIRADCHLCGRCVELCDKGALSFGICTKKD